MTTTTDLLRPPRRTPARWLRYAAAPRAYALAGRLLPGFALVAALLGACGLWLGYVVAPTDFQQGDSYRIIYVHVPAAWLSMLIYVALAFWALVGWVLNTESSALLARALAPTGALMTALALWTGALWGKPTWGAWWVWDARLTSELILLFLYIGFIALQGSIDDARRADRAGALLALVGLVNVPVIYFSVRWWNTLHQGATLKIGAAPSMAAPMLQALVVCTLALWAYAIAAVLARFRNLVLEREAGSTWVQRLRGEGAL